MRLNNEGNEVFYKIMRYQKVEEYKQENTQLAIAKLSIQNQVTRASSNSKAQSFIPFRMMAQPFAITQSELDDLMRASALWQRLVHLAALDGEFILSTLSDLHDDPMVSPLLELYQEALKIKHSPGSPLLKPKLDLFRSDYFLTKRQIKLIEFNNLAVSMAGVSHNFQKVMQQAYGRKGIIDNTSLHTFAQGINDFYVSNNLSGVVVMTVQQGEVNLVDQKILVDAMVSYGNFNIERVFFCELESRTHVDENGDLILDNGEKVAIVYHRAGYSIGQCGDECMRAKKKVEFSNAIPVPWVGSDLAGQKRIQAELSKLEVMKKFITEKEAQFLFKTVIETWDFPEKDCCKAASMIAQIQNEGIDNFVLKPNAEGGNNNYFGEAAYKKFKCMEQCERSNFIMTRKIVPRRTQTAFLTANELGEITNVEECEAESEVSIYGTISSNMGGLYFNRTGGFLVRSKSKEVNEGGLMSGKGVISGLEVVAQLE